MILTEDINMKIIESSQFQYDSLVGKDFDIEAERIGTSRAGSLWVRNIEDNQHPLMGYVWLSKDENGKCKVHAYNFDSSD
jgi:hypothetical protein